MNLGYNCEYVARNQHCYFQNKDTAINHENKNSKEKISGIGIILPS